MFSNFSDLFSDFWLMLVCLIFSGVTSWAGCFRNLEYSRMKTPFLNNAGVILEV